MSFMVNTLDMHTAVEQMNHLTQEMRESLERLNQARTQYVQANVGVAIEEYDTAQKEWNAGLEQMGAALGARAQAVSFSADTYQNADLRGRQIISGR